MPQARVDLLTPAALGLVAAAWEWVAWPGLAAVDPYPLLLSVVVPSVHAVNHLVESWVVSWLVRLCLGWVVFVCP